MFRLGERLSACASLVQKDAIVADIGTDHAKLPVYLIHNDLCKGAIASDIAKKPYEGARTFVRDHDLADKIDVRLGAGLEKIAPDEVTDIVIAGMGGELISQILEAAPWTKDSKYNLVLQPMSKASVLREWLMANGYEIMSETPVTDSGRDYTVINSRYTGEIKEITDIDIFAGKLIPCKNDAARRLLRKQAKMLEDQMEGLSRQGNILLAEQVAYIISSLNMLSEE